MTTAQQTPMTSRPMTGAAAAANAASFSPTGHWMPVTELIDVGHSKLAYRRVGEGPDLVLVHGWPLHSATYRRLLPRLRQRFTCHLFDLPGTGDSVWDRDSQIGLRAHAASLREALSQLDLQRYALLAHDSGALITRLVAADNPAAAGLVMGNTEITGHHSWQVKLYEMTARLPGGLQAFGLLLRSRTFRRSPLGLGGCFADLAEIDGEFHRLFIKPLLDDRRTIVGQLRLVFGLDQGLIDGLAEVHAQIAAPVQMIWGVDDPFFPLAKARGMMSELPGGAELVELRPGKLFVHEERPDAFCDAAIPFLERCLA